MDRREISRRIKALEKAISALEPDSELHGPFESALASRRRELAGHDDVLDGVRDHLTLIQVEATFPDGTKLVSVHDPIGM